MTMLYNVYDHKDCSNLIMVAPLDTIRQVFKLHQSATDRVVNETENGGPCILHFNGKPTAVALPAQIICVVRSRVG